MFLAAEGETQVEAGGCGCGFGGTSVVADGVWVLSCAVAAFLFDDPDDLCARAGGWLACLLSGCLCFGPLCAQYGRTPAYRAAAEGHTEALQVLIEARADVNKADKVSIGRGSDSGVLALLGLVALEVDGASGRA